MQSFGVIKVVAAIFGFEDYARLSDFHGVPGAGGYLAAKMSFSGIEAVSLCFGAVGIEDYLVETPEKAHYALGRMRMPMHGHFGARQQGIQYSLRIVIGGCAQVIGCAKPRRFLRLSKKCLQKFRIKHHGFP